MAAQVASFDSLPRSSDAPLTVVSIEEIDQDTATLLADLEEFLSAPPIYDPNLVVVTVPVEGERGKKRTIVTDECDLLTAPIRGVSPAEEVKQARFEQPTGPEAQFIPPEEDRFYYNPHLSLSRKCCAHSKIMCEHKGKRTYGKVVCLEAQILDKPLRCRLPTKERSSLEIDQMVRDMNRWCRLYGSCGLGSKFICMKCNAIADAVYKVPHAKVWYRNWDSICGKCITGRAPPENRCRLCLFNADKLSEPPTVKHENEFVNAGGLCNVCCLVYEIPLNE